MLLHSDGLPLLSQGSPSTEVVIEDVRPPEYRCNYCYGCLLCDRGYAWYSLRGKGAFECQPSHPNMEKISQD